MDHSRRRFLGRLAASGALCLAGMAPIGRPAHGMGVFSYPQGFQKIAGDVRVNGTPAQVGDGIQEGDWLTTGPGGMGIFVIEKSVYLIRSDTRMMFTKASSGQLKEKLSTVLRIIKGKVLSVHTRKNIRIETPTSVVGLRGTGVYVEAEPDRTYLCICYGQADIRVADAPEITDTVKTRHHEAPRFIYRPGVRKGRPITTAPVMNHTDAELIMLERLVWRRPPFVPADDNGNGGGGGGGGY